MKAARINAFGPPHTIHIEEIERPVPAATEICVEVVAAGVGPWDALVRQGFSALPQPLPLTLGSDVAGVIAAVGRESSEFSVGDEVFGVTNPQFTGGYAEYANVAEGMIARKPSCLSFTDAASVPVVAVTALQMLFDYAGGTAGQHVLIHGGAGNVGAFAVQLAKNAGLQVSATASSDDVDYVRGLGADLVIDYQAQQFEKVMSNIDVVIDTVGGEVRQRSYGVLKPGGKLVTSAAPIPEGEEIPSDISAEFFLVDVTRARLEALSKMFEQGVLRPEVGTLLPLDEAISAHEMLAGVPHSRGKIVLEMQAKVRSRIS